MNTTVETVVAGSWIVTYSFSEKKGARRQTLTDRVTVQAPDGAAAEARATELRGHLDRFQIVAVGPEIDSRPMTRQELSLAIRARLDARTAP